MKMNLQRGLVLGILAFALLWKLNPGPYLWLAFAPELALLGLAAILGKERATRLLQALWRRLSGLDALDWLGFLVIVSMFGLLEVLSV